MSSKPNIYVLTGAGISAPSGIHTWRSVDNAHKHPIQQNEEKVSSKPIWEQYDKNLVCNYKNWKQNRSLVFEFYDKINKLYSKAKPNNAHKFLANLQKQYGVNRVRIITQNVDNLLEDAGCKEVLHLHGEGGKLLCTKCNITWSDEVNENIPCGLCGTYKYVKPSVIFFGEDAPKYKVLTHYFSNLKTNDIVIVCGTNGQVVNLKNHCNGSVMYDETNYILNVYDDEQYHQIPSDKRFYGVECCTKFLPKVKKFIDELMSA